MHFCSFLRLALHFKSYLAYFRFSFIVIVSYYVNATDIVILLDILSKTMVANVRSKPTI